MTRERRRGSRRNNFKWCGAAQADDCSRDVREPTLPSERGRPSMITL
jgi:hypothetical protein